MFEVLAMGKLGVCLIFSGNIERDHWHQIGQFDLCYSAFRPQPAISCSKLTIEALGKGEVCLKFYNKDTKMTPRYGVFIANFEHISHLFLVFLLLTFKCRLGPVQECPKLTHNFETLVV